MKNYSFWVGKRKHPTIYAALEREEGRNISEYLRRCIKAYETKDNGDNSQQEIISNQREIISILITVQNALRDGIVPVMPDDMGQEESNWEALENLAEQL